MHKTPDFCVMLLNWAILQAGLRSNYPEHFIIRIIGLELFFKTEIPSVSNGNSGSVSHRFYSLTSILYTFDFIIVFSVNHMQLLTKHGVSLLLRKTITSMREITEFYYGAVC